MIHYAISEDDFDLSLIPLDGRERGTPEFRQRVTEYITGQYQDTNGEVEVEFRDGSILVTWISEEDTQAPMDAIFGLLEKGKYEEAAPMLKGILQANPNDQDALYNLGMVYSDQGRLGEARTLLRRATEVSPTYVNAWVALGIAAYRDKDNKDGRMALEHALDLDAENLYALRTLGALEATDGNSERGIRLLRTAVEIAPDDAIAVLGLAQVLYEADRKRNAVEVTSLLKRVLHLNPQGDLAERAKDLLRQIAGKEFRDRGEGGLRPDAISYCLAALEKFGGMDNRQLGPILMEIATLGQGGLPVNDPTKKFRLRSLDGEFTALQIVCMLHVGCKILDPNADSGFDIGREYEEALGMYDQPT